MRDGWQRTQALLLALMDGLMVLLAMQLAWWLRFDINNWWAAVAPAPHWVPFTTGWTPGQPYVLAAFVALPIFWLIFRETGLYEQPEDGTGERLRILAAVSVACVLLAAVSFYVKVKDAQDQFQFSRGYLLLFLPSSVLCVALGRGVVRAVQRALARQGIGQNRILFVGSGALAEELAAALAARGTNVVAGCLTDPQWKESDTGEGGARQQDAQPLKRLGGPADLVAVAERERIGEVVVALPEAPKELLRTLAEDCYRAHVRFRIVPDVYEMLLDHMDLTLVNDIPLLGLRGSRIEGVNYLCKRLFDIAVSVLLLLVLVPLVFVPVAIAIKLSSPGPVFYSQPRLGFRRRTFRFWKFRSMRTGADSGANVEEHKTYLQRYIKGRAEAKSDEQGGAVFKLKDDPRITPIGRFIRAYSIDELPQLFNVLLGDMSLIGPRPPVAYEVEHYRPIHLRRFEVLPGISGLWQVSGRNRLTFDEMVKLDLYYIENWSLELDVRILFRTIRVVLFQKAY